ncbi:MAG: M15 family metallopeptidase [Acidimicrobiales bacterium]
MSTVTAADLPSSWRPGCPLPPERLRMLRVSIWGFDGRPATGTIVIGAAHVEAVEAVFRTLYDEKFPIRRMEPVDAFGGDDRASMAADNTSGFNCRNAVASGPPRWSAHAFGEAIDLNPVENPYLQGGEVQPPDGASFLDRSQYRPGMVIDGGVATTAFAAAGWSWGGRWGSTPDYQHFSVTGA